jgi:O-antigen ligase
VTTGGLVKSAGSASSTLLAGALGWAALVTTLGSALALGANRPVAWTLLAVTVFLLFSLQMLLDLLRGVGREGRALAPIAILFVGVLGWALFQAMYPVPASLAHPAWAGVPSTDGRISADPISSLHHVMRLACYGMIFWIALRSSSSPERADAFLAAIAVFSTGLVAFGLFSWSTGSNLILGDRGSGVVSASFINRNSFATYAVFGLLANLALYLKHIRGGTGTTGRDLRDFLESFFSTAWIFAFGTLVCASGLLLSQSRAGLVAGSLALLAFFAVRKRDRQGSGAFILLSVVVLLGFAIVMLSSGVLSRLVVAPEEDARFVFYPLVVDGILERPWLGHGLGAFHDTFRMRVPIELAFTQIDLAHSSYLENTYELGIPAAFVFYIVLGWIGVVLLLGVWARERRRRFAAVAFAAMVAAAFHAALDFSLQMPATAALFAFILGIGWAQAFERPSLPTRKERPVTRQSV